MRAMAVTGMRSTGATVHDGGTVVVIQGPRFSTRAESASYAAAGFELVNMTQMPESALCRRGRNRLRKRERRHRLRRWHRRGRPVTHAEVLGRFAESIGTLKQGIRAILPALSALARYPAS